MVEKELLDFESFLLEEEDIQDENGYYINSNQDADRFLKKVKILQEQEKEIDKEAKKHMEAYAERVNAWAQVKKNKIKSEMDFRTEHLQDYLDRKIEEDSSLKSIKLPIGTIRYKKVPIKYKFKKDVERDVVECLKEAGLNELVSETTNYKYNATQVKKFLKTDGEKIFITNGEANIDISEYCTSEAEDKKFEIGK